MNDHPGTDVAFAASCRTEFGLETCFSASLRPEEKQSRMKLDTHKDREAL